MSSIYFIQIEINIVDKLCSFIVYSQCSEECRFYQIAKKVGCRGPWMPKMDFPICSNYSDTKNIIVYSNDYSMFENVCKCKPRCTKLQYNSYIVRRQYGAIPKYSTASIFYSYKFIQRQVETWSYDFTQFFADAGGSLGFVLGVSVIGIVEIFEKIVEIMSSRKEDKMTKQDEAEKVGQKF